MRSRICAWGVDDPPLRQAVEHAVLRSEPAGTPLPGGTSRLLRRLDLDPTSQTQRPTPLVVKSYLPRRGVRALREALKTGLRRSGGRREWNALRWAQARALPVPAPIARGYDGAGHEFLVMSYVSGLEFPHAAASASPQARERLVDQLVDLVHALHGSGLAHMDLHVGNLLVTDERIFLLDLAQTRRTRGSRARLADWSRLLFSLERTSGCELLEASVRERAKLGPPLDAARVDLLHDHQRGRARRQLRVGQAWRRVAYGQNASGLADDSIDDVSLLRATLGVEPGALVETRRSGRVRIHRIEVGGKRFVCKEVRTETTAQRLGDALRGTSSARAFRRGQADQLISSRSAEVLGYLDVGGGRRSASNWLVMTSVGEIDLDAFVPASEQESRRVALALADWVAEQHARGLSHRDFKAGNIRLRVCADSVRFWLIDLTDLVGPARLSTRSRITALVQLNASLADAHFDTACRLEALTRYAARVPFEAPLSEVAEEIAIGSLARAHHWRGQDCPQLETKQP